MPAISNSEIESGLAGCLRHDSLAGNETYEIFRRMQDAFLAF
jgi:hypothetical protein